MANHVIAAMVAAMYVWSKLSAEKWRDAWEERFLGQGQTNAVISMLPGRKTIRVEVYFNRESDALKLKNIFGGSIRKIKQEEWSMPKVAASPPMRIRGKLVVTNTLEPEDADLIRQKENKLPVLHVPPGLAFGTGDHATTSTCLRVLCDYATAQEKEGKQWSLADLGTGTGILAMAAKIFGASDIYAMDFDPFAVRAAKANISRNKLKGIVLEQADLTVWKPARTFDFIAANVFANVLTLSLPTLRKALANDGTIVISGILRDHWPDLMAAGVKHGLVFPKVIIKGKWVTACGHRAPKPTAQK